MDWLRLESPAYWFTFVAAFLGVALWETLRPARPWMISTGRRWGTHGVVMILGTALAILIIRLTPVAAAAAAANNPWGILNQPAIPYAVRFLAGFLAADFIRYAAHRLLHTPWLWRLHRVHHADPDYDITTSLRFHPLETVIQRSISIGLVFFLAPPVAAVLTAELVSCIANFFDHANANLPPEWDRQVRRWIITPSVHRVHHSADRAHQGKNLGELLPWWDRLFGTYAEPPPDDAFAVGMTGYQNEASMNLARVLAEPFRAQRTKP